MACRCKETQSSEPCLDSPPKSATMAERALYSRMREDHDAMKSQTLKLNRSLTQLSAELARIGLDNQDLKTHLERETISHANQVSKLKALLQKTIESSPADQRDKYYHELRSILGIQIQ